MFGDDPTSYVTSLLNPDTIRWINKRQSNKSNSLKAYLFPPLTLQIYEMLNRMEGEFIGNPRIAELHTTVRYVVEYYKLETTVKRESADADPEGSFLNGYVGSDRSGGVEFAEYLALNYDQAGDDYENGEGEIARKPGDIQALAIRKLRLHAAFDELCNYIRRKRIDQKLKHSCESDVDKYNSMVELFGINYFKTNSFESSVIKQNNDRSKKYPNMVIEKSGMRNYKKENSIELHRQRKIEVSRVNQAAHSLGAQRDARVDPKTQEKLLKFWEEKGELLPLFPKRK